MPNITPKFSLAVEGEMGLLAIGCFQFTPVFFCHVLHHLLRLDSVLHVHCLLYLGGLICLALPSLHELITVSYWAAPFLSLVEHFLVSPTSHYVKKKKKRDAVFFIFIQKICLIFNQLGCWQHLLAPFCITIFLHLKWKNLSSQIFPLWAFFIR